MEPDDAEQHGSIVNAVLILFIIGSVLAGVIALGGGGG